jgi:hypothetical protein
MASRKRRHVPEVDLTPRSRSTAYEDIVLGQNPERDLRTPPQPSAEAEESRDDRLESDRTRLAIDLARDGDDSLLLPYQPTPSINPPRPRTLAAGYDRDTSTLRVRFRDGTPWEYYNVPPRVWKNFRAVKSPGRFINRVLNNYPYARGDF